METLRPETPEQLAQALQSAAAAQQVITLGGAFSKQGMAGPAPAPGVRVSSAALTRIYQYEPQDLTISVGAGIRYRELSRVLAENRQMIPLDPPFSEEATIGGILGANTSGPRRRLYGTARDLVIGMRFATLEGRLVQSGGMVVKNVAGLDMAKMLIGAFGTLAAIAVANFKLIPMPPRSRSFLLSFDSLEEAISARDGILRSVLQPAAIDLLDPNAAERLGGAGFLLLVQAGGNAAVMERYARELAGAAGVEGDEEDALWRKVRNFTPDFLAARPDGAVIRISCLISRTAEILSALPGPAVARAGSGVCYGYFNDCDAAAAWLAEAAGRGWKAVMEFAPDERKRRLDLWPSPGSDFEIMKQVKRMFDPANLLNPGRLYGRL